MKLVSEGDVKVTSRDLRSNPKKNRRGLTQFF